MLPLIFTFLSILLLLNILSLESYLPLIHAGFMLLLLLTLQMEVIYFSETSADFRRAT
jgi:hypothetical protein